MSVKQVLHEIVVSNNEKIKLNNSEIFNNRNFMVFISDLNGNILFEPFAISNFSIDEKKIFITLYDIIQEKNIEETLDALIKGLYYFRPKLNVTLIRLGIDNKEIYRVNYHKCILKKYHGKNLNYKGDDKHQWYLELKYHKKEIVKNKEFVFKNSNKMMDDAIGKVISNERLDSKSKKSSLNDIYKAKNKNDEFLRYLDSEIDYQKLEKEMINKINDLENNINK